MLACAGSRYQGGRGQWAVYYTCTQSFITLFSYSVAKQFWGLFEFDLLR